ncbi:MAG: hypothetical protein ACTS6J_22245, partial [Burkholderiales bacterium]
GQGLTIEGLLQHELQRPCLQLTLAGPLHGIENLFSGMCATAQIVSAPYPHNALIASQFP